MTDTARPNTNDSNPASLGNGPHRILVEVLVTSRPEQVWKDRDRSLPFRAPHHTIGDAALDGKRDCPGELALAAGGLLVFDEAPLDLDVRQAALYTRLANAVHTGRDRHGRELGSMRIVLVSCIEPVFPGESELAKIEQAEIRGARLASILGALGVPVLFCTCSDF